MKISIPNLPSPSAANPAFVNPLADLTIPQAVAKLQDFLEQGNGKTLVLTGAGVSVDSGIRAYRGDKGRYTTNPNFRPIFYGELVEPGPRGHKFRDVDRLHHKASAFSARESDARILELHGTLHFVHCIPHSHVQTRDEYQTQLGRLNPRWEETVMEASGGQVQTNPDGDVELKGANYDDFVVPECPECQRLDALRKAGKASPDLKGGPSSIVKPNVVFFGETISDRVKERSMAMVAASSQLLVLGTSLATYSAFRLIKQALEGSKPVLMVSTGPSRADGMRGMEKIDMEAGPLLREILKQYTKRKKGSVSQEVQRMMNSGVTKIAADLGAATAATISSDEGSTLDAPTNTIFGGGDFSLGSPMRRFARSRREYSTSARTLQALATDRTVPMETNAFAWKSSPSTNSRPSKAGQFAGKRFAIKDNFMRHGTPTGASSLMLRDFVSPYTATSVQLLEQAGADIIGKTNMDEFGMGSLTTNLPEDIPPVINPFTTASPELDGGPRSAGGSSGGSAAAVASGEIWAALGTDTGGSIRLPASYCGIVGLKPSYGMISRHGVISYADSLDCLGILARNVCTIRQVFPCIAQPDAQDATCVSAGVRRQAEAESERLPLRHGSWGQDLHGLRIGVPYEASFDPVSTPLDIRPQLKALQAAGAELVPVSLPSIRLSLPAYYVIACAEASSNLARYGGEFFGGSAFSSAEGRDRSAVRSWGFGEEARKRVLAGTHALTAGAFENSYLKAMHLRRKLRMEMGAIFRQRNVLAKHPLASQDGIDVLLHLTALRTAPRLEEASEDETHSAPYGQDILTVPASLAGLPCISIPGGLGTDGWPVGISLTAQWGMDEALLAVADKAESIWSDI